ncbi:Protein tyrosine kinase [Musa troglodytarum]|uniref:Protein tyrosine kinase n=1 Tax=Musa troglodytarum TaxID=320322 RepID=A0A9E7JK36_9LILI|nr:Protein tyrosine kinase [Musa troglodytarum]
MCKTRGDVDAASPRPNPTSSPSASAASDAVRPSYSFVPVASSTSTGTDRHARRLLYDSDFDSSAASVAANLRLSLSQDSHPFRLYSFTEILSATDRFLAPPLSPSADSWRCRLRGGDAVVFRRPFLGNPAVLPSRIAALCRSHHGSVVELLGASLADDHIYFVYSYVAGASLFRCLRNPQNPSFTPLASWFSRVQVAADVAQGLEYIHHHSETATPVKSSGIIITEPGLRAKICHFGAAELAGEIPANDDDIDGKVLDESAAAVAELARSRSRGKKIEWTRGYMAPEVLAGGVVSRRSDVFAFGVVLLELLSGEEPVRYLFCQEKDAIEKVSVIETARAAMRPEGEDEAEEGRRGRIRRWVDRRLGDSFPVEGAEEGMRVALRCVAEEAAERPQMVWVAGKLSKLLIQATAWDDRLKTTPTRYLTSVGPR